MNNRYVYDQIVLLTHEIESRDIAEKLFFAVEEHDEEEFYNVFRSFINNNHELIKQIQIFKKYCYNALKLNDNALNIFGKLEDEKIKYLKLFNPNIIDALSFLILVFCLEIDDACFFDLQYNTKSLTTYLNAIYASGYHELANFLRNESWLDVYNQKRFPSFFALLEAIFNGEFE